MIRCNFQHLLYNCKNGNIMKWYQTDFCNSAGYFVSWLKCVLITEASFWLVEKLLLILFLIPLLCEFYPVLGIDSVQEITDFFFLSFICFGNVLTLQALSVMAVSKGENWVLCCNFSQQKWSLLGERVQCGSAVCSCCSNSSIDEKLELHQLCRRQR